MAASDEDDDAVDRAEDAPEPDEDGGPDEPGSPRRRVVDGRTLAVCALVALIAALLAGFVANRVTAEDDDEAAGQGTLTIAEDVPDVALERFDGTEVRPSDYLGQPLVINFWASWCMPCIDEMPAFQDVHESLGDQVAFLGVNTRDAVESAEEMIDRTGVTYDLARDTSGDLARALDVATLPVTVLVLPDGTVVQTLQREVSAARLCEAINQSLLNQALEECG